MSASKTFHCHSCEAEGKIVVRSDDVKLSDIVYCPVCGADILDEYDTDED